MDQQLPDRQAAASEAGKMIMQHPYDQHWSSSGLCSLPTAPLPVHQWLHIQRPLCQAPEVCRRYHTDWPHPELWEESSYRQEVKELAVWCSLNNLELNTLNTHRRHPPPPPCSPPTHHHEQHCDCTGVIQIPGHHNFPRPEVGQSHWVHCEKGPAETVLGVDRLSAWPIIGADIKLFTDYRYRPFSKHICRYFFL